MKRKFTINLVRVLFLLFFAGVIVSGKMVIWLLLFVVTLPMAVLYGRIFCGYVCPMNTVMVAADALAGLGGKKKNNHTAPTWLQSRAIPWIILLSSVLALLLSRRLLKIELPLLPFFVLLSFFMTLIYKPEVFHNCICPFGALQKIFGRWALRTHDVKAEACIGCRKCELVCPALAVAVRDSKKAVISPADCLQCQNCSLVCPTKAIAWQKKS